jgi:hypothetical protein
MGSPSLVLLHLIANPMEQISQRIVIDSSLPFYYLAVVFFGILSPLVGGTAAGLLVGYAVPQVLHTGGFRFTAGRKPFSIIQVRISFRVARPTFLVRPFFRLTMSEALTPINFAIRRMDKVVLASDSFRKE